MNKSNQIKFKLTKTTVNFKLQIKFKVDREIRLQLQMLVMKLQITTETPQIQTLSIEIAYLELLNSTKVDQQSIYSTNPYLFTQTLPFLHIPSIPMIFYIPRSPQLFVLSQLILKHGGILATCHDGVSSYQIIPYDDPMRAQRFYRGKVYSSAWITESILEGELLNRDDFLVVDFDDVLFDNQPSINLSKNEQQDSHMSEEDNESEILEVKFNFKQLKLRKGMFFSVAECIKIWEALEYASDNKLKDKGTPFWREIARSGFIPNREPRSLCQFVHSTIKYSFDRWLTYVQKCSKRFSYEFKTIQSDSSLQGQPMTERELQYCKNVKFQTFEELLALFSDQYPEDEIINYQLASGKEQTKEFESQEETTSIDIQMKVDQVNQPERTIKQLLPLQKDEAQKLYQSVKSNRHRVQVPNDFWFIPKIETNDQKINEGQHFGDISNISIKSDRNCNLSTLIDNHFMLDQGSKNLNNQHKCLTLQAQNQSNATLQSQARSRQLQNQIQSSILQTQQISSLYNQEDSTITELYDDENEQIQDQDMQEDISPSPAQTHGIQMTSSSPLCSVNIGFNQNLNHTNSIQQIETSLNDRNSQGANINFDITIQSEKFQQKLDVIAFRYNLNEIQSSSTTQGRNNFYEQQLQQLKKLQNKLNSPAFQQNNANGKKKEVCKIQSSLPGINKLIHNNK
eukprot:403351807